MESMTHAWFDVSAGVAGDMLLGSLIDAGADLVTIQQTIDLLIPGAVRLSASTVNRGGQRATKLIVEVLAPDQPHRTWKVIRSMIADSALHEQTRSRALAVFHLLAEAEATVHGTDPEQVHFHEVGALDSIADVVGTCEALRLLGAETISASPVALGSGRIQAAHGDIPVPAPAVAHLAIGWQVSAGPTDAGLAYDNDSAHHLFPHNQPAPVATPGAPGELATPTGLAIIRALARICEPMPHMVPAKLGVGAGDKDFRDHPNIVRTIIGKPVTPPAATEIVELAANVDDMPPELWPGVIEELIDAGALDAWLVPITMKKGRPAHTIHALCPPNLEETLSQLFLEHTSTIGVRAVGHRRVVAERVWTTLTVAGQPIDVKIASRNGVVLHASPEFDSLAAGAQAAELSRLDVTQRVQGAIVAAGLVAGAEFDRLGLDIRDAR
ncbi:hypothetical protein HMPREF1531_01541 [Propionibacterium sp. oral taxon 192 str. F0372]|nr:hypothetical protein HMPREF1531_01541 [Propionibacterium sp. oral taxon 192 str. F0372]